jgi:hypothetical protein
MLQLLLIAIVACLTVPWADSFFEELHADWVKTSSKSR